MKGASPVPSLAGSPSGSPSDGPSRVLFVGKNHLPYVGGSEISTHHLARSLQGAGHSVSVLSRLPRRSPTGLLWWAATAVGVHPAPRREISLGYPTLRAVDPVGVVLELSRELAADVAVVTCGDPRFAEGCLNAVPDIPSILYVRDARSAAVVGTDVHADVVVANSRFVAGRARGAGRDAVFIPSIFPRNAYEVPVRQQKVLFVNPTPRKGVETALAVAAARPDIPFVFRLSWRMRRRALRDLRLRAHRLRNVEVQEATADPAELFAECRLVLVPSIDEEAWCRVVSEAQINGIPSIASASGGFPESVGPGGVLVSPPDSTEAWVRALSEVWDDRGRYDELSRRALEYSRREEMEPENVTRRFELLIDEAIERHAGCRKGVVT